jgi:alpha-ketoglutarate-dependent taurine dioxygenase
MRSHVSEDAYVASLARDRLRKIARSTAPLTPADLVHVVPAATGSCVELRPAVPGVDPVGWSRLQRDELDKLLIRHGAVLFRGFGRMGAAELQRFVEAVSGVPMAYTERSSPRRSVGDQVYTSTEYPADQTIPLHNENSYQRSFPQKIFFLCVSPADTGGATLLADTGRVLTRISPATRDRFQQRGWMYVRNFGGPYGLRWQEVFQTDDRAVVEARCQHNGIRCEWTGADRLRMRARRTAVLRHPRTGTDLWFNHATFFHVSSLPQLIRDGLMAELDEGQLPSNTYYGDGSAIEADVLDELRSAYDAESIALDWERGDFIMIDNLRVAHGRAPFSGPRRVLFAMSEPFETDRAPEREG